ncbi:MAG: acyl transferase [Bacteroidia bacterium]
MTSNPKLKALSGKMFSSTNEESFRDIALEVYQYQSLHNKVYAAYHRALKIDPLTVNSIELIPFLPVEFFKHHKVITEAGEADAELVFTSSGTSGQITSRHYVPDPEIYEKSFSRSFELFYGSPSDYCILALLPSYLEREGSSLVYMADKLIRLSGHSESGFYLNNYTDLINKLENLKSKGQKTLLLGVTYALLDLADAGCIPGENCIVMETGGMKGKRKEMVREELHAYLKEKLKVKAIHSEYGMTELLSQAYSKGEGIFHCPAWMKILIRDINDPFSLLPNGKSGGINVIDLANLYSCSFIANKDLGKKHADNSFEVLGRFDNSDIRGCNLMVE